MFTFHKRRNFLGMAAIAICCLPSWAHAGGNLLQNGGFDTPTPGLSPPNYPTSISGAGSGGPSSAEGWSLFNNYNDTTSTELLPTTDPTGSPPYMIHLTSAPNNSGTPSFFNGLLQSFSTQPGATASVDVYLLSGEVLVGLYSGNGATLVNYTFTTLTDQWQTLSVTAAPGTNPNLLVIYAYDGVAGATTEFYADNASVTSVPEPSSGLLALTGISAMALCPYLRRRKREKS